MGNALDTRIEATPPLPVRWSAVAFTFLSEQDRTAWLASIDRTDRILLTFARHLDGLLEHADEAGRPIRPQDAAAGLLRAAADEEAAERRQLRFAA